MQLQQVSKSILDQLIFISEQLTDEGFRKPLSILSHNSIGKHIRHIVEFYDLLVIVSQLGEINYDMRSHDKVIEENRLMAIEKLSTLKLEIENISADHDLVLNANYSINEDTHLPIRTSLYRALQYNIEHSIHHMAIIKMALLSDFELVTIPEGFGIAYSTIKYEKEQNVHSNLSS